MKAAAIIEALLKALAFGGDVVALRRERLRKKVNGLEAQLERERDARLAAEQRADILTHFSSIDRRGK